MRSSHPTFKVHWVGYVRSSLFINACRVNSNTQLKMSHLFEGIPFFHGYSSAESPGFDLYRIRLRCVECFSLQAINSSDLGRC